MNVNQFKEQWIKYKLSELHPKDLIQYGSLYGIKVKPSEASALLHLVKTSQWSLADKKSIETLLFQAEEMVSKETYQVLKQLFNDYVR